MLKRILIFIMIFTIIFNFISYGNAYATTATFGDIYGTELGSEMLSFVLASLAVGVTYSSLAEVEEFIQAEIINWSDIVDSAPEPPPGGGHNPNKKLITALLLGVPGGAFLSSIFGDLIIGFQNLGAKQGENEYLDNTTKSFDFNGTKIDLVEEYYDSQYYLIRVYKNGINDGVFKSGNYDRKFAISDRNKKSMEVILSDNRVVFQMYFGSGQIDVAKSVTIAGINSNSNYETIKNGFNYNVRNNSSVITNIPPSTIPQPDISIVPGIETITTPQGDEKLIYPGDFEDLSDDIVHGTTFEDISELTPGINPYNVTETQQGLNINRGIEESPFPDIDNVPIEDTSAFQGENISLIKSIINWLSLIRNDISSLPDKLFNVPPDLSLNFDNLKLNGFQDRFPFSIPWDIAAAIGVFSSSPMDPDLTIDMDTNYFSVYHEIDISAISLPLRFARYAASVFFVLYLANKTRDLIKW